MKRLLVIMALVGCGALSATEHNRTSETLCTIGTPGTSTTLKYKNLDNCRTMCKIPGVLTVCEEREATT